MAEPLDWPGAYLIGAPKCGTTALARYLSEHPGVCVSAPKEPHYLATDLPGLSLVNNDADYLNLYTKPAGKVRVDASIWYLYSESAVANILERRPDARFVVMLRNPVKMVPSLHRQLRNALDEDVEDFATAWNLSEARARGQQVPAQCRAPSTLIYTKTAAFGEQIDRLLSLTGRERTLVLFQEELQRDARKVYCRVLEFLELADDGRTSFEVVNEAVEYKYGKIQNFIKRDTPFVQALTAPVKKALGVRSLGLRKALHNVNSRPPANTNIAPELAEEIARSYQDDMRRLATLLDRDLGAEFGWRV